MRCREYAIKGLELLTISLALSSFLTASATAQRKADKTGNKAAQAVDKAEASNMELVGFASLEGMGALRPYVKHQGDRWIAYVGSHSGAPPLLNPVTGQTEPAGTMIVDVTDPKHPKTIAHVPAEPMPHGQEFFGKAHYPAGDAEYVRVCGGSELPHAEKGKFYMLRDDGNKLWEIWDVTDPAKPTKMNDVLTGITGYHEPWWECDTGIAYLPSGLNGWPLPPNVRRTAFVHMVIFDLSNPAKPVLVREWGLPGQNPGSTSQAPIGALHTEISTGPQGNRLYVSYGQQSYGIFLILDRDKLLNGPKEPTDENLRYPIIARVDLPVNIGAHTSYPLLQMDIPEFAKQSGGSKVKDFLAVTGEQWGNECQLTKEQIEMRLDATRQMVHMFDISEEARPVGVSTWTVSEASGNFCSKGGRFGSHETQNTFEPIYYKRVLFVSHFNAGVRAVDIRDPYHPKEIGYYIPALNKNSGDACAFMPQGESGYGCGKKVMLTDHLDVDDRGYIYIVDRQGGGMHILQLTGMARQVADFSQTGKGPDPHVYRTIGGQ